MIQAYSTNQTILTNGILPFNSTSLKKGNTTTLNGVSSLMLNSSGVYQITLNLSGLPSTAGDVTVAMTKDGVSQPEVLNIPTVLTTTGVNGSITLLVPVFRTCCGQATSIQFVNTGVGLTEANINVVVTKLC